MLKRISDFISSNQLISPGEKVMIGVSGGMDSMALAHCLKELGYTIALAHVNYKLREEESDGDEEFVRNWAVGNDVDFYVKSFETSKLAKETGESIQMVARRLRYDWFNVLLSETDYDKLAVAHHLDDSIETVVFNLVKGTGVKGFGGIQPKRGQIIRPFLSSSHADIEAFMLKNEYSWREDSSNSSLYYSRNFIRHKIMPVLSELNPSFRDTFKSTSHRLSETSELLDWIVDTIKAKYLAKIDDNRHKLVMTWTQDYPVTDIILFELLRPFGVSFDLTLQISRSLTKSGAIFKNQSYDFLIDRNVIIISPNDMPSTGKTTISIDEDDFALIKLNDKEELEMSLLEGSVVKKDAFLATVDKSKLSFPLYIRSWEEGDRFRPLGMKGFKKISDFFIDQKIPVYEKAKIKLLVSGEKIVWVIGYRLDDRFKVVPKTKETLLLSYRRK